MIRNFIVVIAVLCNCVMAATTQQTGSQNKKAAARALVHHSAKSSKASQSYFDITAQLGHYFYGEKGLMNQRGPTYGGSLIYSRKNGLFGENAFSVINLDLYKVKGYYRSIRTGKMANDDSSVTKLSYQLGFHLNPSHDILFGYGARLLTNDTSGMKSTTGHVGYNREQIYTFIPLKWVYHKPFNKGKLSFGLGSDIFLSGEHQVFNFLTFTQNSGWNLNGDVAYVEGPYLAKFHASYWDIDKSTVRYGVYEPKNHTFRYGLSLGMRI